MERCITLSQWGALYPSEARVNLLFKVRGQVEVKIRSVTKVDLVIISRVVFVHRVFWRF